MKNENNETRLTTTNKNSVFNFIKSTIYDYFEKQKEKSEIKEMQKEKEQNKNIIKNLSESKLDAFSFEVDTTDTSKIKAYYEIKNNKDKVFAIGQGDFDNVKIANDRNGGNLEPVNIDMKVILQNIKQKCNELNLTTNIGKPEIGDEVFFLFKGDTKQDLETKLLQLKEYIKRLRQGDISITFDYSLELENGIQKAIRNVDNKINIAKEERKKDNLNGIFFIDKEENRERNLKEKEKFLISMMEHMMSSLRICVKELSEEQKQKLKESFLESLTLSTKQSLILQAKQCEEVRNIPKEDLVLSSIDKIESEIRQRYKHLNGKQEFEQFVQEAVLAKTLQQHPIAGIKSRYFKEIEMKQEYSELLGENLNLEDIQIIDLDISGVKEINDTKGHPECDRQMNTYMGQIKNIMSKYKIEDKCYIIANHFASYTIISKGINQEILNQAIKDMRLIETDLKPNIVNSKIQISKEEKRELKKQPAQVFNTKFKRIHEKNKSTLHQMNLERKISKNDFMVSQINSIVQSSIFIGLKETTGKDTEQLLSDFLDLALEVEQKQTEVERKIQGVEKEKEGKVLD